MILSQYHIFELDTINIYSVCKSLILHAKINAWHRQVYCPIVRFYVKDADRSGPPSYSENILVVDGVPL